MKAQHLIILGTLWLILAKVETSQIFSTIWHLGSMALSLVGVIGLFIQKED